MTESRRTWPASGSIDGCKRSSLFSLTLGILGILARGADEGIETHRAVTFLPRPGFVRCRLRYATKA